MKDLFKNTLYHYKVYGLHVASEIELTELMKAPKEEHIDVHIIKKQVSNYIRQQQNKGIRYRFEPNDIWYEIKNLGIYHIKSGCLIEVDCSDDKDLQDVKAYLLGTAFGCLMVQRQQVAIHGGTIVMNHKAVIFTGDSGAGKSTLTTALRTNGYAFLADDVSAIAYNTFNQITVQPAFPQQKLCKDAMTQMGYTPTDYMKIDEERDKYLLPVSQHFINHAVPLGSIVEISISSTPNVQLEEVKGTEKLSILLKNIYRSSIWSYLPMPPSYFKQCMAILNQAAIYKLQRPEGIYTVEEQIELLTRALQKQEEAII